MRSHRPNGAAPSAPSAIVAARKFDAVPAFSSALAHLAEGERKKRERHIVFMRAATSYCHVKEMSNYGFG